MAIDPLVKQELTDLNLKSAKANLPMEGIQELRLFLERHAQREEYEELKHRCESWISMIYFSNNFWVEAFEIILKQLKEDPYDHPSYYSTISSGIRCSDELNRRNDVVSYVIGFILHNGNKDLFSTTIFLFEWYGKHYSRYGGAELPGLTRNLDKALKEMLCQTDQSASFEEKSKQLAEENRRAGMALRNFKMAYGKASEEDRKEILSNYLGAESIPSFIAEAKSTFKID